METPKDSKVTIGGEQWTIKYIDKVIIPSTGRYVKAARIPARREILLSLTGEDGKKLSHKEIVTNANRAVLPMVIKDVQKQHPVDLVEAVLDKLGFKKDDYGI